MQVSTLGRSQLCSLSLNERQALKKNVNATIARKGVLVSKVYSEHVPMGYAIWKKLQEPATSWAPKYATLLKMATWCGVSIEDLLKDGTDVAIMTAPAEAPVAAATTLAEAAAMLAAAPVFSFSSGRGENKFTVEVSEGRFTVSGKNPEGGRMQLDGLAHQLPDMEFVATDGTIISIRRPQ